MTTLVVDASVAVKWFMAEPDSGLARETLARPGRVVAPELVLAEVLNATWAAMRRGQFAPTQFQAVAHDVQRFFDDLMPLRDLAARAAAIAERLAHPVYDCFYLALAEREAATMVTADTRLIRRVAGTVWAPMVRDLSTFASPSP